MSPAYAFVLFVVAGLPLTVQAQLVDAHQINPPFGFYWGEGKKEMKAAIDSAGGRLVGKDSIQGREAWTIKGLPQPALKQTIVYFGAQKNLVEVELQYQHARWDLIAYQEFLEGVRKRLQARYGPPTVLAKQKRAKGNVMETFVGYQWQNPDSSIELFFYSAEGSHQVFRSVSLHYRAG